MHSITEFEANIPAFLAKLWSMVEEPKLDELIAWGTNGLSFVIKDQTRFSKELLPMYYKHNNMASFIRQLNMYGFHKNLSLESGCAKMEEVIIEFYHPCFQKNNPSLLPNIKRKINTSRGGGGAGTSGSSGGQPTLAAAAAADTGGGGGGATAVKQALADVRHMKWRQDSVESRLTQIKQENQALWREVALLRHKHIKQQHIVNKLIQFLVSLVQPHGGISVKRRNIPLMLQDRSTQNLNKNNQGLGGISDISRSPTGPVIHEIDPKECATSLLLNATEGITSPQDASMSVDNDPDIDQQSSAIGNDGRSLSTDDDDVMLDLPNQLFPADESADRRTTGTTDQLLSSSAQSSADQLFARPNRIRASRRRPRKPAATKKVAYKQPPEQPDDNIITGLVLEDFPLIIPGSKALEQLNNLSSASNDDVTQAASLGGGAMTSPISVNLSADLPPATSDDVTQAATIATTMTSPISVNLPADSPYSAELAEFSGDLPVTIVNSRPTIVNNTVVPIVAQQKSRYKKIAPKLIIPEQRPQMKVIRPQRKRRSSAQSRSAGKKTKSSTTIQDGGKSGTQLASPANVTAAKPLNNDRTVACMTPTNSQQSLKQEIDNHVDTLQNDLEALKELLKGESISLDANTLLGKLSSTTLSQYLTLNKNEGYEFDATNNLLFNSEDPFLAMDLPTQMQTEDKSKSPDNNQLVSYSTPSNLTTTQELGDLLFDEYNDWILSPSANDSVTAPTLSPSNCDSVTAQILSPPDDDGVTAASLGALSSSPCDIVTAQILSPSDDDGVTAASLDALSPSNCDSVNTQILSPTDDEYVYQMATELNTPEILLTPEPPQPKKRKK